jgi:sulfatase modifying factor 1
MTCCWRHRREWRGRRFFLPSEDEWYKAAFYDPVNGGADGGGSLDYWLYATMVDSAPILAASNTTGDITNAGANVANYDRGADWNGEDGNVTTVGGAGASSRSFYGTSDQSGNVWEWTDLIDGTNRSLRGGSWVSSASNLTTGGALSVPQSNDGWNVGFRLASIVPEPSRGFLILLGMAAVGFRRRR